MNTFFRKAGYLLFFGLLIWFLFDAPALRSAAQEALSLCARSVVPALLPFFVVSDLLIALGFGSWLSPLFSGLMALYHLPGCAGSALLLGLVGGYPVGPRVTGELYRTGQLTEQEAERLLGFCNNSNPVFLISILGAGIFHSTRMGLYLWLIHLLSALLTGFFFRGSAVPASRSTVPPSQKAVPFPAALAGALGRGGTAMLSICTCVVFFYVLLTPLRSCDGLFSTFAVGFVELFSLTARLTPDAAGFILAAGCSGWGGLSVLSQTAAVLGDSGLSVRPLLLGKAIQGLISALLAGLLTPLLF